MKETLLYSLTLGRAHGNYSASRQAVAPSLGLSPIHSPPWGWAWLPRHVSPAEQGLVQQPRTALFTCRSFLFPRAPLNNTYSSNIWSPYLPQKQETNLWEDGAIKWHSFTASILSVHTHTHTANFKPARKSSCLQVNFKYRELAPW